MAASLSAWLARFIESEVAAVIGWKQGQTDNPHVKQDPELRFSDDGSNFRSLVTPDAAPSDQRVVQIIKVITTGNYVTVMLSDGETKIKARISDSAKLTLDEEKDVPLEVGMHGDVLRLMAFTVVSTPYGPADGFIQLSVDAVEYEGCLRKCVGSPRPIEEYPAIKARVQEIESLRTTNMDPGDDDEEDDDDDDDDNDASLDGPPVDTQAAYVVETPVEPAHIQRENQTRYRNATPSDNASLSSLAFAPQVPQVYAQAISTQVNPRKRQAPSLSQEGFEVQTGTNLDLPTHPGHVPMKFKTHRDVSVGFSEAGYRAELLDVLGSKRRRLPQRRSSPPTSLPSPQNSSEITTGLRTQTIRSETPSKSGHSPENNHQQMMMIEQYSAVKVPEPSRKGAYERRKIPAKQKKLLNDQSSWLPSIVGKRFPHPNVPTNLLQEWIELAVQSRQVSPEEDVQSSTYTVPSKSVETSSDNSSDEEITNSQWPPSPTQRRAVLPPDSPSRTGVIRGTPAEATTQGPHVISASPNMALPSASVRSKDLQQPVNRPQRHSLESISLMSQPQRPAPDRANLNRAPRGPASRRLTSSLPRGAVRRGQPPQQDISPISQPQRLTAAELEKAPRGPRAMMANLTPASSRQTKDAPPRKHQIIAQTPDPASAHSLDSPSHIFNCTASAFRPPISAQRPPTSSLATPLPPAKSLTALDSPLTELFDKVNSRSAGYDGIRPAAMGMFEEFFESWKDLRPDGAFAHLHTRGPVERRRMKVPRNVDVLTWAL